MPSAKCEGGGCPGDCGTPNCAFARWAGARGLPSGVCKRISGAWRTNHYKKGNILFYQGNDPLSLFFLSSGMVKLVRADDSGRQHIMRVIHAPDLVGDRALLAGHPYAASAHVMGDAQICSLEMGRFKELWETEPELSRMLARYLAHKLAAADEAATDLALCTIRQRLARLIVHRLKSGESVVELSESRQEIADLLGTSPEVLSRTLSEFDHKGLVSVDERRLKVLNLPRLRAVARVPGDGLTFVKRQPDICHWPHGPQAA
jgi:CRP/FNR family transcriptional regulator